MKPEEIKLQVGVKVILGFGNSILLLKRSAKYKEIQNSWDIPGGRIDSHETLIEALGRELSEEIGLNNLDLSHIKLLTAQDIMRPEKGFHTVRLSYELKLDEMPEVKIDDESQEYRWFSRVELVSGETLDPFLRETLVSAGYL